MCFGTSSGRLSQLCHFGPLIAMFLISYITLCGLYCILEWWPPNTIDAQLHIALYLTWPFVIYYNYFNAVFLGPGFVPVNWRPENKQDEEKLQFCKICNSFKAPRSHHCRKCNRCVLKMDHHCPWINTCCGHFNHASFVYFLFTAPLGCIHAICVLGPSIYRAIFRNYYIFYEVKDVPIVTLSVYQLIGCMFAVGMAFGVVIAVGFLGVMQAVHRRKHQNVAQDFIYPYDLGKIENLRQVFNWNGDFRPIGNGIWWNIVNECDQFTLTIEQLSQKEEKRNHAVKYLGIRNYNGSYCPIRFGFKTLCCFPWSDDPRMSVSENENILVTRWQRHWLYGEKIEQTNDQTQETKSKKVTKGWFPSKCVRLNEDMSFYNNISVTESTHDGENQNSNNEINKQDFKTQNSINNNKNQTHQNIKQKKKQ